MNKATRRTCFYAFVLTLCVLGLGLACFTVECNLRQTVYGRVETQHCFSIEEGLPTLTPVGETPTAPTPTTQQGVCALLPPGVRAAVTLLRWEAEAAARFWDGLLA